MSSSRLAGRLAITIALPALVVFLSEQLLLPGIPTELVERILHPTGLLGLFDLRGRSLAQLGVFGLGVTPILTAYWMVEVAAFLVPPWSRLRHSGAGGRDTLDRAARVLALVLSAIQAVGVALWLRDLGRSSGSSLGTTFTISIPLVVASLVAGVCIQFIVAHLVSRQGLVNGLMALVAAPLLSELLQEVARQVGAVSLRDFGVSGMAVVAAAGATWAALRGAGNMPPDAARDPGHEDAPYRDARRLVIHPWIPVPSGSFQAYSAAAALVMLPAALAAFAPTSGLAQFLRNTRMPALVVLNGLLTVVFGRLLHRPAEMADLAGRLGAGDRMKMQKAAADALRGTWLPSFLFLGAILLASTASPYGTLSVVIVTAVATDLGHAIRANRRTPEPTAVWEERTASAVPVIRAVLAESGIPSETCGMAVLSFWQVFVPYAPATILVPKSDAARATAILARLLGGAPAAASEGAVPAITLPSDRWSTARRTQVLAATAGIAGLALVLTRPVGPPELRGPISRAKLEIVRVDDTIDAFASVPDESLPEGEGIGIYSENAPVGPGKTIVGHYARIVLHDGETDRAAASRLRRWLAGINLPPQARFGVEDVSDFDPDTKKSTVVGVRTFVLRGESVLGAENVTDAAAAVDEQDLTGPSAYVAVTLTPDAAVRFEDLTRGWIQRRLAIIVDDVISSAPVIKAAIPGGHVSITLGRSTPEQQLAEADELVRRLRGR